MPITVVKVGEAELLVWPDHYLRRGYRCRVVESGLAECSRRINEVMDHVVVIKGG